MLVGCDVIGIPAGARVRAVQRSIHLIEKGESAASQLGKTALDFLPMVKKEMAEGPVPPPTAPFFVGNDKSFGRWRGKSLASVPPE